MYMAKEKISSIEDISIEISKSKTQKKMNTVKKQHIIERLWCQRCNIYKMGIL